MKDQKKDLTQENNLNSEETNDQNLNQTTNEGGQDVHPDTADDIDDFAQALLNRKVEMALYPEDEKIDSEKKEDLSTDSKKEAEDTFSNALDQLRRERGQVPIEEEEENFLWDQLGDPIVVEEEEDFTTADLIESQKNASTTLTSLYDAQPAPASNPNDKNSYFEKTERRKHDKNSHSSRHHSSKKDERESRDRKSEKTEKTQNARSRKGQPEEEEKALKIARSAMEKPLSEEPQPVHQADHESRKPKKKLRKKAVWTIVGLVVLILALFGAYVYKVQVYDPAHQMSEEVAASYKKLQNYADEYSMASDAEKQELLSLSADYDALNDKQKEDISNYFKEQTGMTYSELVDKLNADKEKAEGESNPDFASLLDYAGNWNGLSDDEKNQIADKAATYDSLSDYQKGRVDQAMENQTGKSFTAQADEVKAAIEKQKEEEEQQRQEDLANERNEADAAYQEALNQLIADRSAYAEFLAEEGLEYDEVMQQYDDEIAYYQNLLNGVQ